MSHVAKNADFPIEKKDEQKIKLTLTSRNVKALEKTTNEIVNRCKEHGVAVRGPVRLPTKNLRITVRKSPCGNGSETFDRFEMRIHKRYICMKSATDAVKRITSFRVEPGVEIEVEIAEKRE